MWYMCSNDFLAGMHIQIILTLHGCGHKPGSQTIFPNASEDTSCTGFIHDLPAGFGTGWMVLMGKTCVCLNTTPVFFKHDGLSSFPWN